MRFVEKQFLFMAISLLYQTRIIERICQIIQRNSLLLMFALKIATILATWNAVVLKSTEHNSLNDLYMTQLSEEYLFSTSKIISNSQFDFLENNYEQ